MIISSLVKGNLPSIGYFQSIYEARSVLRKEGTVFVKEEERCVGILTMADLGRKGHVLVADCLTEKPSVVPDSSVAEVLAIMAQCGHEVLPVKKRDAIVGVIHKDDLVKFLHSLHDEKDSLFFSVVHDLRAPLHNLVSFIDLLKPKMNLVQEDAAILEKVHRLCTNSLELLQEISSYAQSGLEKGAESEYIDLRYYLRECLQTLEPSIQQADIKLVQRIDCEGPVTISLQATQFYRVIENLILNAVKFTPAGGSINVHLLSTANDAQIVISDTGIGIPKELQVFIFEKLSSAKRLGLRGEATVGLGLYIVKNIVEVHGGTITFESMEGAGTTFTVTLPLNSNQ